MSYKYEDYRSWIFTDEGSRALLRVRDRAFRLIEMAGAARLDKIIKEETLDGWEALALVDRLVEIGDLVLVEVEGKTFTTPTQYRIYTRRVHG